MHALRHSIILATLLAALVVQARAVEGADLSLGGKIQPNACQVALSTQTIDYGNLNAGTLQKIGRTVLPDRSVTVTIACSAPAPRALTVIDNRDGTEWLNPADPAQFGLGKVGGRAIGHYALIPAAATGDGKPADVIDGFAGSLWYKIPPGSGMDARGTYRLSWAPTGAGTVVPGQYQTIVQSIIVKTNIAPRNELPPLSSGLRLDGLVTFSLIYL